MKKINTLIILLFAAILRVQAYSVPDTIIIRSDAGIEKITADLDSLVNCWYVKMALQNDPDIFSMIQQEFNMMILCIKTGSVE